MCLNDLILENLQNNPDAIALINGNNKKEQCNYREFLQSCFSVIDFYKIQNLKPNQKILIPGIKTKETYFLIISSIFYGLNYTLYDPKSPSIRLEKIIETLLPDLIIVSDYKNNFAEIVKNITLNFFDFSLFDSIIKKPEKNTFYYLEIIKSISDSNINAYIMFTSGSTGVPKGAIISRKNLYEFIIWIKDEFQKEVGLKNTNINPLYFDNSIFDIFSTIPFAQTLIYYDLDLKSTLNILYEDFYNSYIFQWFSVPSLLIKILKNTSTIVFNPDKKSKKIIIFGGEGFSSNLLREMMNKFITYEFINVYGPTECTCIATLKRLQDKNFLEFKGLPSLGKVVGQSKYKIIDKDEDGIGELLLEGNLVGEGYINNHNDNNKFNKNKDLLNTYKTGDLVKEIKNELFHCGRIDNQIKRLGFRIELEEIEYVATSINYIDESAAIFQKDSTRSYLILIVKLSSEFNRRQVLKDLKMKLPLYMFPDDILITNNINRNRNGKIDRKKLIKNLKNFKSFYSI